MTDNMIRELSIRFRKALETARDNGLFIKDFSFNRFPHGCCGDTCYLLAEYLMKFGINTIWYSATRNDWSHAWLVVKDDRVKEAAERFYIYPEEIWDPLRSYGIKNPEEPIDVTRYEESDLSNGLIIDITADQFKDFNLPVYVGKMDSFHAGFLFNEAEDYKELCTERLNELYKLVEHYL